MGKSNKKGKKPTAEKRTANPENQKLHAEIAEEWLDELEAIEELEATEETEEKEAIGETKDKEAEKKDALREEAETLRRILARLMDDLGIRDVHELSARIDEAEMQKLMGAHNLSEEAARLFLAQQEKLRTLRRTQEAAQREAEYIRLREDPIYADILERRDAIESFILRTGTTPREAYGALFAEERLRALLEEERAKKTEKEKAARAIPALSRGGASEKNVPVKLTEAEKWAAKRAGMTPEEYAKYKK